MKFAVDCMLGKLAKWLKILGFDAVFFSKIEDDALLSLARAEDRILLTKDNALLERAHDIPSLYIDSENWREQIVQVIVTFKIRPEVRPFTRCIECNLPLKNLDRPNAKNLVTPFVYKHAEGFAVCPGCSRIFWRGTHFRDMETKIEKILSGKK